jgi:hypothetical protein
MERAFDRSGHELRIIDDVEREYAEMTLGFDIAAIDVEQIAEDLKGVKGNCDRQDEIEIWYVVVGRSAPSGRASAC